MHRTQSVNSFRWPLSDNLNVHQFRKSISNSTFNDLTREAPKPDKRLSVSSAGSQSEYCPQTEDLFSSECAASASSINQTSQYEKVENKQAFYNLNRQTFRVADYLSSGLSEVPRRDSMSCLKKCPSTISRATSIHQIYYNHAHFEEIGGPIRCKKLNAAVPKKEHEVLQTRPNSDKSPRNPDQALLRKQNLSSSHYVVSSKEPVSGPSREQDDLLLPSTSSDSNPRAAKTMVKFATATASVYKYAHYDSSSDMTIKSDEDDDMDMHPVPLRRHIPRSVVQRIRNIIPPQMATLSAESREKFVNHMHYMTVPYAAGKNLQSSTTVITDIAARKSLSVQHFSGSTIVPQLSKVMVPIPASVKNIGAFSSTQLNAYEVTKDNNNIKNLTDIMETVEPSKKIEPFNDAESRTSICEVHKIGDQLRAYISQTSLLSEKRSCTMVECKCVDELANSVRALAVRKDAEFSAAGSNPRNKSPAPAVVDSQHFEFDDDDVLVVCTEDDDYDVELDKGNLQVMTLGRDGDARQRISANRFGGAMADLSGQANALGIRPSMARMSELADLQGRPKSVGMRSSRASMNMMADRPGRLNSLGKRASMASINTMTELPGKMNALGKRASMASMDTMPELPGRLNNLGKRASMASMDTLTSGQRGNRQSSAATLRSGTSRHMMGGMRGNRQLYARSGGSMQVFPGPKTSRESLSSQHISQQPFDPWDKDDQKTRLVKINAKDVGLECRRRNLLNDPRCPARWCIDRSQHDIELSPHPSHMGYDLEGNVYDRGGGGAATTATVITDSIQRIAEEDERAISTESLKDVPVYCFCPLSIKRQRVNKQYECDVFGMRKTGINPESVWSTFGITYKETPKNVQTFTDSSMAVAEGKKQLIIPDMGFTPCGLRSAPCPGPCERIAHLDTPVTDIPNRVIKKNKHKCIIQ